MDKPKSSVIKTTPKPVSVFYVWYSELCRRLNITPAPAVKPAKPKCQTVLDFVADRLKIEEWSPVLNALRQDTSLHVVAVRSRIGNCQFLHDIDTEEKAKNAKRKYGCIWTAYVMKQLLKSISYSLRSTQVLTYLELDGLPMFMQYLEPLLQALKRNTTLKTLSLSNCALQDGGCQLVCSYLRFTPNIEVLNLSGCHLSPVSGEHLAKLIKYQQINRYCESWHTSLRYENPDAGKMRGLKRITINSNPYFADVGLTYILNELEDDLWIKALDLQKCGLTENIADKILDVVNYNKTLEIVDLRQNDMIAISTVEKILHILRQRQQMGGPSEFQWCATAVTLTWSSVYSATSKCSFATNNQNVHKTKSAPMKTSSSKVSAVTWDPSVRKTKTTDSIQKYGNVTDSKKQVLELNTKLQREILKRKQIEKRNEELQSQLNHIKTSTPVINGTNRRYSISADRNGVVKSKTTTSQAPNPIIIRRKTTSNKGGGLQVITKPKTLKNGLTKNGIVANGYSKNPLNNNVHNILEKLLNSGQPLNDNIEEEMLKYFSLPKTKQPDLDSIQNSHVSLYKYMEELKADKT